jgi:FtsH-binding integral membrane protein
MQFIRKVYSILACQLTMTVAFILLVQYVEGVNKFMFSDTGLALNIVALVGYLVCLYAIICCYRKKTPHNYYLLFGFTACMTFMIGGFTATFERDLVILAGLATALTTIALTVYAMRTK